MLPQNGSLQLSSEQSIGDVCQASICPSVKTFASYMFAAERRAGRRYLLTAVAVVQPGATPQHGTQ